MKTIKRKPSTSLVSSDAVKATRGLLIEAAGAEFNAFGYFGTDTNRIARRAQFAPQTFYRHFVDKLDVFLAVYDRWQTDEALAIATALRGQPRGNRPKAAAEVIIRHHRDWAVFRRSLRLLAVDHPKVRLARTNGRKKQIAQLAALPGNLGRNPSVIAAAIFLIERLCDALADDEVADLGYSESDWADQIALAVGLARGEG
jgi:AcrR family transcriptional regulator